MTTKMRPSIGPLSEFVLVSSTRAGYRDLLGALGACADRLVDPAIAAGTGRDRLARLAISIFIGSFVVAGALALVLPGVAGPAGILAAISATLALSWLAALSVSTAKAEPLAAGGVLAGAALVLGGLVAASGGIASPLALLLAGLVAEPLWVYRSRKAVLFGLAALASSALAVSLGVFETGTAQPWFWAPVVAYLASLAARLMPGQAEKLEPARHASAYAGEDAIAVRFGADGEVAEVPVAAPAGFGIEPNLLVGTGLLDRVHVADRVAYLTALADMRDAAGPSRVELRLRLPIAADEPTVNVRFGLFELNVAASGNQAVLRQLDDVADLRAKLDAAEKYSASVSAAKSRLLASVSHELRTPLNAIIGFSDMLLLDLCGQLADARQREHVTLVRDAGNHLLSVVNAILDVSRIESGVHALVLEPFRFADAVDLCHSMIAAQAAAKQIAIRVDIGREVGELTADRRAVQQILINLVSNAVKFTPAGGTVTISAERIGSRLGIAVADNGIGIAKDDLLGLGQPFTQVRNDYTRQYDGLGLGLSLVKGLVALHGGSMEIESAPGEGTTVEISLPVNGPATADGQKRLVLLEENRPKDRTNGKLRKTA
jgi:cell cycle sensor histidine kinase DivJ